MLAGPTLTYYRQGPIPLSDWFRLSSSLILFPLHIHQKFTFVCPSALIVAALGAMLLCQFSKHSTRQDWRTSLIPLYSSPLTRRLSLDTAMVNSFATVTRARFLLHWVTIFQSSILKQPRQVMSPRSVITPSQITGILLNPYRHHPHRRSSNPTLHQKWPEIFKTVIHTFKTQNLNVANDWETIQYSSKKCLQLVVAYNLFQWSVFPLLIEVNYEFVQEVLPTFFRLVWLTDGQISCALLKPAVRKCHWLWPYSSMPWSYKDFPLTMSIHFWNAIKANLIWLNSSPKVQRRPWIHSLQFLRRKGFTKHQIRRNQWNTRHMYSVLMLSGSSD